VTQRSRAGEYVVIGCFFAPTTLLFAGAILLPGDPRHGNGLLVILGLFFFVLAAGLLLLQLVLPRPPAPRQSPDAGTQDPETGAERTD